MASSMGCTKASDDLKRLRMNRMAGALLTVFLVHPSVYAADKIRISMTGFAGQFMTFPLAQKRGFLEGRGDGC